MATVYNRNCRVGCFVITRSAIGGNRLAAAMAAYRDFGRRVCSPPHSPTSLPPFFGNYGADREPVPGCAVAPLSADRRLFGYFLALSKADMAVTFVLRETLTGMRPLADGRSPGWEPFGRWLTAHPAPQEFLYLNKAQPACRRQLRSHPRVARGLTLNRSG